MDVLRPSLLPGLLDSLRHNLARKNNDVALFEIGRVFGQTNGKVHEERRVAFVITGKRHPSFWAGEDREARFDASDLKGLLEEFMDQFGLRGWTCARRAESTALCLESATVQLGKQSIGEIGQLLPSLARRYDLRDAVLLAELNLDLLLARRNASRTFKALPAFPAIRRDVAMLVPEATTHDAVLNTIKQAKPAEPGERAIVRRVPRQERAGRPKEHGLRLHLSQRRTHVDRCRSERRTRKARGAIQKEPVRQYCAKVEKLEERPPSPRPSPPGEGETFAAALIGFTSRVGVAFNELRKSCDCGQTAEIALIQLLSRTPLHWGRGTG